MSKGQITSFKEKWLSPTMLIIYVVIIIIVEFVTSRL